MKQDKVIEGEGFDLSSFGVPDAAVDAMADEQEDTEEEEPSEEEETAEDNEDEDTDDGYDGDDQESEADTDLDDSYDVDSKKSLEAAEKNRRQMQAERDSYKAHLDNMKRQQLEYEERLRNLEQLIENKETQQDPFAGKDDDDYMTVAEAKAAAQAANRKQPQRQQNQADPWLYRQPDYDEVMDYVNKNADRMNRDPEFYGLNQKEAYLLVRDKKKGEELSKMREQLEQMKKREKGMTRKKPRVPKTGGSRVRSKASTKPKMTKLEELMGFGGGSI